MKLQKKFHQLSSYLYTTSSIQSQDIEKIINEVRPYLIINFGKKTEKSSWYETLLKELLIISCGDGESSSSWKLKKYKYKSESSWLSIDCEYFVIPAGDAAENLSDVQKLCQRIVNDFMHQNKRVLLVCYDGMSTSGYIGTVCQWWYEGGDLTRDLVKELRERNDFTTAKNKHQQQQMKQIMNYAKNIVKWKGFC
jgi:hypothetical protein